MMVGAVWNRVVVIGGLALALASVGCGSGTVVDDDDLLPDQCTSSAMCDDGNFCNGEETCDPASSFASTRGCVPGLAPCGADTFCDNDAGVCTVLCGDGDGDGHDGVPCGGDDCDDTNPGRFPGNPEVCDTFDVDEDCNPLTFGTLDEDDDGHVDLACCNEDTAGMRYCGDDCADQRRDTRPGMPEVCDGIDNDCDTMLDEGVTVTGRPDMDFDLHGDEGAQAIMRCADTQGFSVLSDDCDDGRVTAHSAQLEICDGLDNDCDDLLDENAVAVAWYPDDDVDGFGDADATPVISCAVVSGHAVRTGDCDDSDQSLSPSAAERCDGRDNNCDGVANFLINFGDTEDDDEDGFPDMRCGGNDCNDGNPSVYPGAMELCDGVDNDCDGVVDADSADALWYLDLDGDGFGDATGGTMLSCTPIANRIARGGDCDDGDAGIRPAANDACNGIDDDCDGTTDESGLRFPFYPDDDDDGVGDASGGVIFACPGREPTGVSQAQGDCDDDDDTVYAGAPELCDGDDNDCDGVTDEDAPQAWFPDGDSDGRGVPAGGMTTCNPPAGYVLFSDDCNDLDANNFPTNAESCDGVDNDCDSQADDGADAACMLSTGMGVCTMGACEIADCTAGRDDCDTTFATGCEVDTNRNPSHCGACLAPCSLGDSCGATGTLGVCDGRPLRAARIELGPDVHAAEHRRHRGVGRQHVRRAGRRRQLLSRNVPVEGSRGWVEIDAGEGFGCARNAAGRVFCFGSTTSGKLGNGISDGASAARSRAGDGPGGRHRHLGGLRPRLRHPAGRPGGLLGQQRPRPARHRRDRQRSVHHADPVAGDRRHRHLRGLRIHLRAAPEPERRQPRDLLGRERRGRARPRLHVDLRGGDRGRRGGAAERRRPAGPERRRAPSRVCAARGRDLLLGLLVARRRGPEHQRHGRHAHLGRERSHRGRREGHSWRRQPRVRLAARRRSGPLRRVVLGGRTPRDRPASARTPGGGARPRHHHGAHHRRARRHRGSAVGLRHTQRRRRVVLGSATPAGCRATAVRHGGSAPSRNA
jgi:hypothetical protein